MESNDNSSEIKNLVATYELLNNALTSQSNSKAYHSYKKQMNDVEQSALLVLRQRKTYNNHLANKQNGTIRTRKRTKKETPEPLNNSSDTTGLPTDNNTETTGSQTSEQTTDANTDATATIEAVATTQ